MMTLLAGFAGDEYLGVETEENIQRVYAVYKTENPEAGPLTTRPATAEEVQTEESMRGALFA